MNVSRVHSPIPLMQCWGRKTQIYHYWFGTKHGNHHVLFDCVCIQRICLRSFIHPHSPARPMEESCDLNKFCFHGLSDTWHRCWFAKECSTVSMMRLFGSIDVFGCLWYIYKIIKTHQKSWNPYEFPIYQPSPAYGVISSNEPWRPPDLAPKERLETTRATANVGGPVGQWLQHCWSKMVRNSNLHLFTYTKIYIYISLLYICCIHLHYYYI